MVAHYDRRELTNTAMELWRRYGEDYRTKVIRYRFLLDAKRAFKLFPLCAISESDIKNYPQIPFLRIIWEDEAQAFLANLPVHRLSALVDRIEYVVDFDYTYCSLTNRIQEYERQIRHRNDKRCIYAMNPDCCTAFGANRRRTHHGGDE